MALDVVREVQVQLRLPADEAGHMSAMSSRGLARLWVARPVVPPALRDADYRVRRTAECHPPADDAAGVMVEHPKLMSAVIDESWDLADVELDGDAELQQPPGRRRPTGQKDAS